MKINFKPQKVFDTLETGNYKGVIQSISFSNDTKNCWFKISVDGIENALFNTMFTTIDIVFNNFAANYVDEEGFFCTDKIIAKKIEFKVNERVYGERKFSKITAIKVIE